MSTSKRASRSKKSTSAFHCPSKKNWSVPEKQLLLTAIKRHGLEDVKMLQTCVPSRSEQEIAWYIQRIRLSKPQIKKTSWKTPIEKWLSLILELTFYEHEDYSNILSSVMAVIAHGECSDNSTAATTSSEEESKQPNYSRMYQYIGALMSGKSSPELSKIEATIFIDLMYSLADQLRDCQKDAAMVKNLLLYKYEMLNERTLPNRKSDRKKRIRMALENEWPEDNKYGLPVAEEQSLSKRTGACRKRKNSSSQSQSKRVVVVAPECEEAVDIQATDQEKSTHATKDTSKDATVKGKRGKKRSLKSSPADKDSAKRLNVSFVGAQSEKSNEQLELSPSQSTGSAPVSLDNESETGKQKEPESGKQKEPESRKQKEPESGKQTEPESRKQKEPESGKQKDPESGKQKEPESRKQKEPESGKQKELESRKQKEPESGKQKEPESRKQKEPESGKQKEPESGKQTEPESGKQKETEHKEFKKPLLYTLNPLCIPLSLLNLNKNSKDKS